jgi:hypothetical protein
MSIFIQNKIPMEKSVDRPNSQCRVLLAEYSDPTGPPIIA